MELILINFSTIFRLAKPAFFRDNYTLLAKYMQMPNRGPLYAVFTRIFLTLRNWLLKIGQLPDMRSTLPIEFTLLFQFMLLSWGVRACAIAATRKRVIPYSELSLSCCGNVFFFGFQWELPFIAVSVVERKANDANLLQECRVEEGWSLVVDLLYLHY